MVDDGSIPDGLPRTLTAMQLTWLTGLTQSRIGQLVAQGVIIKVDRDQYSIASIRRLIEAQREKGAGPASGTARGPISRPRRRLWRSLRAWSASGSFCRVTA
jgi:hypothetical protein